MSKAKPIGRIVLIALGAIIACVSIRGLMDAPVYKDLLGAAVYLSEPVVLPENEGKMVIIHGKPEMIAPAYDEELGITLDSIKAYRYDQEYSAKKWEKNRTTYDWVSRGQKEVLGEAALGEFVLDEKTLNAFPVDSDYEDFDQSEISASGYGLSRGKTTEGAVTDRWYVIVGGPADEAYYYHPFEYVLDLDDPRFVRELDKQIAERREGTMAYAYKVYTGSVSEEITIAGIQKGNTLVAHEKLLGVVNQGVLTQEALIKSRTGSLMGGAIAALVFGLVLVFLGLRPKNTKKNRNAKGQKA